MTQQEVLACNSVQVSEVYTIQIWKRIYLYVAIDTNSMLHRALNVRSRPVDITKDSIVTAILQRSTEESSVRQVVQGDGPVAFESEMNEIEVLRNDMCRRAREVKGEGVFNRPQVVKFEDELFRKMGFVSPYNEPHSAVDTTKLVTSVINSE